MDRSRRLTIIPAFNEESTIGSVVTGAKKYGDVVVVDDGSFDETQKRAKASGAKVISHGRNKGYEEALNSGFFYAHQEGYLYVLTFDADAQHDKEKIEAFYRPLEEGKADVVAGKRKSCARFSETLFSHYFRFRFGVKDPLCGMKSYKLELYRSYGAFDTIGSIGSELLLFAAKRGFIISQIPVPIFKRLGRSRLGSIFFSNLHIFSALLRVIRLDLSFQKG